MALHFGPETVDPEHRTLPPCAPIVPDPTFAAAARGARALGRNQLALELELAAFGKGWEALDPFPGYTGHPGLATAEAGAYFAEKILDLWAPRTEAVLLGSEPAPEPIMGWLRSAGPVAA